MAGRESIEKEKSFFYAPAVLKKDETVLVKAESRESIEVLKRKSAEICDPHRNVIMERYTCKFNTKIQKEGKTFQSFLAVLRILENTCDYDTSKDELIPVQWTFFSKFPNIHACTHKMS